MFPEVSVLMPAYNVKSYIDEAIQSVLSQRDVSFELLIGDDASTDGTWARIQAYQHDLRVRAWRFRRHRGAGRMWNALMARARGRYLAICDADDVLLPGHLRRMVHVLDRNPHMGVAYGDLSVLDQRQGRRFIHRNQGPDETWDLCREHVWNPGTVIRRSVMLKVGGYRSELPFKFDHDLFLRLAEVTRFQRVAGPPRYLYRWRPGSLSDQSHRAKERMARQIRRETILRRYGVQVPW